MTDLEEVRRQFRKAVMSLITKTCDKNDGMDVTDLTEVLMDIHIQYSATVSE